MEYVQGTVTNVCLCFSASGSRRRQSLQNGLAVSPPHGEGWRGEWETSWRDEQPRREKGRSRDPGYTESSGLGEHFLSWDSGVVWHAWGVDRGCPRAREMHYKSLGLVVKLNGGYNKCGLGQALSQNRL